MRKRLAAIYEGMRGGGGGGGGELHLCMTEGDEDEETRGMIAQVDRNRTQFIA